MVSGLTASARCTIALLVVLAFMSSTSLVSADSNGPKPARYSTHALLSPALDVVTKSLLQPQDRTASGPSLREGKHAGSARFQVKASNKEQYDRINHQRLSTQIHPFSNSPHTNSSHPLPVPETSLSAFLQPEEHKRRLFHLEPTATEHTCFQGYLSTTTDEGICVGRTRLRPVVGDTRKWLVPVNTTKNGDNDTSVNQVELQLYYAGNIVQTWLPATASAHQQAVVQALAINLENPQQDPLLSPPHGSRTNGKLTDSILNATCTEYGTLPFLWACSELLHLVMVDCEGESGAFVNPLDVWSGVTVLRHWTTSPIPSNNDMVIYVCAASVDLFDLANLYSPLGSPLTAAVTTEVMNLVSLGWGALFPDDLVGHAVYWSTTGLGMAPRPAWHNVLVSNVTFDLNGIRESYFFDISPRPYAAYVYQLLYTYLAEVVPDTVSKAGVRGQLFLPSHDPDRIPAEISQGPFAAEIFNVFLKGDAKAHVPISVDLDSYFDMISDFQLAWLVSCVRPGRKPGLSRYHFADPLDSMWLMDCNSVVATNIADTDKDSFTGTDNLHLLATRTLRFDGVSNPTLTLVDAEEGGRLFLIADPVGDKQTIVKDIGLQKTRSITLEGDYTQVFVVSMNTDPHLLYSNDNNTIPGNHMASPVYDLAFARPYPFDSDVYVFDRTLSHRNVTRAVSWKLDVVRTPFSNFRHTLLSSGRPSSDEPRELTLTPFRLNSWAMVKVKYVPRFTQQIKTVTFALDRFVSGVNGISVEMYKDVNDKFDGRLANVTTMFNPEWSARSQAGFYQTFDFSDQAVIILKGKPVYFTISPIEAVPTANVNKTNFDDNFITLMMTPKVGNEDPTTWYFPDYDSPDGSQVSTEVSMDAEFHFFIDELENKPECSAFLNAALCHYAADYLPPAPTLDCKWEVDIAGNIGCISDYAAGRSHGDHSSLPLGIIMMMAAGGGLLLFGFAALFQKWSRGRLKRRARREGRALNEFDEEGDQLNTVRLTRDGRIRASVSYKSGEIGDVSSTHSVNYRQSPIIVNEAGATEERQTYSTRLLDHNALGEVI